MLSPSRSWWPPRFYRGHASGRGEDTAQRRFAELTGPLLELRCICSQSGSIVALQFAKPHGLDVHNPTISSIVSPTT